MLKPELAQQLLDQGLINETTFGKLTSPDPTQTLDYQELPETTPQMRRKWDAENVASTQKASTYIPGEETAASNMGVAPRSFAPNDQEVLHAAQDIQLNQSLAQEQGQPMIDVASIERQKRDAGLPYDVSALSTPASTGQLTSDQAPKSQSPDAETSLMQAFDKEKRANVEAAQVGQKQAVAESAYMDTMVQEQERLQKENMAREQVRQDQLQKQMSTLNEKLNTYSQTPASAQPFHGKSIGGKLLAGIALFLGAAPSSSTQNTALATMQAAVDADLAKQRVGIEGQKGIYHDMYNTFQDQRQAEIGAKIAYLDNAKLKLSQIASQYKGQQAKVNADALNAKIDEQKAVYMNEFAKTGALKSSDADEMVQGIYSKIPASLRDKALEEKATLDKVKDTETNIDKIYKESEGIGFVAGNTPKSESKARLEANNATIASIIQDSASGKLSEAYIKKIISPFTVDASDGVAEIKAKAQKLKSFVRANAKSTPLLSGFGIKTSADNLGVKPRK